ncbi:hypothetical protein A2U01_0076910, partial [Trifolium medium]|nr:hypothetical protein [Trifolium medium]
ISTTKKDRHKRSPINQRPHETQLNNLTDAM